MKDPSGCHTIPANTYTEAAQRVRVPQFSHGGGFSLLLAYCLQGCFIYGFSVCVGQTIFLDGTVAGHARVEMSRRPWLVIVLLNSLRMAAFISHQMAVCNRGACMLSVCRAEYQRITEGCLGWQWRQRLRQGDLLGKCESCWGCATTLHLHGGQNISR